MRDRYLSLAVTLAAGAMIACSDGAVEEITAPKLAEMPATPVANTWPSVTEFTAANIPNAIGMQIYLTPWFEDQYRWFVVSARVTFQWANEVSATVNAWLVDKAGKTTNSSSAGMAYRRLSIPVSSGDTTFIVKVATNNTTCGLVGKSSSSGVAAQVAINLQLVQVTLWRQEAFPTNGPDVVQPACPPEEPEPPGACDGPVTRLLAGTTGPLAAEADDCASAPPPDGGGEEPTEVCYTVWREYWIYDFLRRTYTLYAVVPIGVVCYTT